MSLSRRYPIVLLLACAVALSMPPTGGFVGSAAAQSTTGGIAEAASPTDDSSSDESPPEDDSSPDVADEVSVNQITDDEAIQRRLTDILQATDWYQDVEVSVRKSVAFLDGSATSDDRKEWAGRLARNTEGVAAVVNRLAVDRTVDVSQAIDVVSSSVKTLWKDFLARSPLIVAGVLALVLTALISKLVTAIGSRVAQRSGLRISLQDLLLQLLTIGVWIAGLLVAAVIIFPGMTPGKALTVLGLGSVAIGFAFKDIFENFFAGILILWKYPFDRGDFIKSGEIEGRIEDITIRMTMVRQVNGELIVAPNAMLFKNPVDVLTSKPIRRTTILCGVAYDVDLDRAQAVLREAVEGCETVRKERDVEIFAQEFADSSINFEVTWWTGSKPFDTRESRDEVVRAVKRALDKAGIEIPFPQRTLWLPEPVEAKWQETSNGEATPQQGRN